MKEIYVDGAGSNQKTLCGGWAYAVYENGKLIHSAAGGATNTTNNRMELQAVLEAYKYIKDSFDSCIIYCDSAYIVNTITQNWYKKWLMNGWKTANKTPVLNQDLWIEILKYVNLAPIEKVAAHTTVQGNILVDKMAVSEKKKKEAELLCPLNLGG